MCVPMWVVYTVALLLPASITSTLTFIVHNFRRP